MTGFYECLRATAHGLLLGKGQAMTLQTSSSGTYNPETGAAVVPGSVPCIGAVFEYPSREIDGTQIVSGDQKIILSAEGLAAVPDEGDTILVQGVPLAIIRVQRIAPAGVVVVYKLQVRGGG